MNIYKIHIPKSVIYLVILSVILNILRVVIWGKLSFVWMLWNITLALIPFFISSLLLLFSNDGKLNKTIFIVGMFLWILFIPNAPYILTDFIHLGTTRSIPILYDIVLLFSSALTGLVVGFYSFSHIEKIVSLYYKKTVTYGIMGVFMFLASFGVYLGRFLRFNSWDIFINHTSLVNNIWKIISQAAGHKEVYLYTGLLFLFLSFTYTAWKYSNINYEK